MSDLKAQVKKLEEQLKPKAGLFSKNPLEVRIQAARSFGDLKIPKGHPIALEVIEQLRNAASKDESEKFVCCLAFVGHFFFFGYLFFSFLAGFFLMLNARFVSFGLNLLISPLTFFFAQTEK